MKRSMLVAVVAAGCFATPEQSRVYAGPLSGWDDVPFARALVVHGYPDLAERLLDLVERDTPWRFDEKPAIQAVRIDVSQAAASEIADPAKRKAALGDVLVRRDTFIERWADTAVAADCANGVPDLCAAIGETLTETIRREKDEVALAALRTEADEMFRRAEAAMRRRIDEMRAISLPDDEADFKLMSARYDHARTRYLHALIFPPSSARRIELCKAALDEYGEFELDYVETLLNVHASVDIGLCLAEIGKPAQALKSFDQAIVIRESWGDRDAAGVWPIVGDEIRDIVCYAMLQKVLLLTRLGDRTGASAVAMDYLASIPEPWRAPSSIAVARELAHSQIATGDAAGAAKTARELIEVDPDGLGAEWGRQILAR